MAFVEGDPQQVIAGVIGLGDVCVLRARIDEDEPARRAADEGLALFLEEFFERRPAADRAGYGFPSADFVFLDLFSDVGIGPDDFFG